MRDTHLHSAASYDGITYIHMRETFPVSTPRWIRDMAGIKSRTVDSDGQRDNKMLHRATTLLLPHMLGKAMRMQTARAVPSPRDILRTLHFKKGARECR